MSHNIQSVGGRAGREPRQGRLSRKGGAMGTRTSIWAAGAALATLLGSRLIFSPAAGAASSPADQGVTAKTIAVGLPYVDFAALKSLGVTINDGRFPDAYNGVIGMINAQGGINGRKLVLSMAEMNPSVPADATSSCTQLTEDDHVFVAIAPGLPGLLPADPRHARPRGIAAGHVAGLGAARLLPRPAGRGLDPLQLAAFKKAGDFKGKKVAHLLRRRLRRP